MIRIFYTLLLALLTCQLYGQDNYLSQFFANRIYLNPAFAGLDKGVAVTLSGRNQWYKADKGYSFGAVAVEWQEHCWNSGFGLTVQSSQEGLAPLITSGAGLTYAYILPYGKNGNVHFGLQYSYNQKRLDWSRLTFSDELDPVFGPIFNSAVTPLLAKVDYHDFSFGTVWRFDSKLIGGRKSLRLYRSHIGLAIQHLWSFVGEGPDESFSQSGVEVPSRITLHAGTIMPLTFLTGSTHKVVVSPNFRFETQGAHPLRFKESLTLFSAGSYFIYEQGIFGAFYNNRGPLPGLKNTSSLTFSLGFTQKPDGDKKYTYYLGISADVNATGLGTRSGNVYEINLRYNFKKVRPLCEKKHKVTTRETVMECKDFY